MSRHLAILLFLPSLGLAQLPPRDIIVTQAIQQVMEGSVYKLRGAASVETSEFRITADEIDYDEHKAYAEARGNAKADFWATGEHVEADRAEYDLGEQTARFWNVRGTSPARATPRPGVLLTSNPYTFAGAWAERIGKRFLLHQGFVTNCKLPRPWWTLSASTFDVVPNQRAIARNAVFRFKGFPLFYTPVMYKKLGKSQRQSGFLTPGIANSSRRGLILDWGYYWAISRSQDVLYRPQLYTARGWANHVDYRAKPATKTDLTYTLFSVADRGLVDKDGVRGTPAGGYVMKLKGSTEDLGWGFRAYGEYQYLSSFRFRKEFTEGFYEAINNEVKSDGALYKQWSTYSFAVTASSVDAFSWLTSSSYPLTNDDQRVTIRRLPSVEFRSRDQRLTRTGLPLWLSFESSAAFLSRSQDSFDESGTPFNSGRFVQRYDFEPRITSAIRWKQIQLIPSFSARQTRYSRSLDSSGSVSEYGIRRRAHQFDTDLILPALERYFGSPGSKTRWKHVIEPRAYFRYAGGVGSDYERIIRFDETELLTDTKEVDVSITNRLYRKQGNGQADEVLTWRVSQRRYFDPTFGGAIRPGERNVLLSSVDFSAFAFLDGERRYSPVASSLRSRIGAWGMEWRTDYDPLHGRAVNNFVGVDTRPAPAYYVSAGHSQVHSVPMEVADGSLKGLAPEINLLDLRGGYGQRSRQGLAADFAMQYSYRESVIAWTQVQATYNTECCGWSVQYRRIGYRNDSAIRFAFSIANLGSLGSLRRSEIY
jgi:LPS-assembly protein